MTRKQFEADDAMKKKFPLWKEFYEFWEMYGKKVALWQAIRAYHKLNMKERQMAFDALPEYVQSTPNVLYRCHPATWLNQKRFYDETIVPKQPKDPFLTVALDIVNQSQPYNGSGNNQPIRRIQ